ncbi:MAG TPA: DUF1998 domain-containing protein [Sedimentisphaerales bacterium]
MSAKKPVRRSQLISPFGIGSMMDFPDDESLMPAGLDVWPSGKEECPKDSGWLIREERLEARLNVTHFRMPPDYKEEGGDAIAYKPIPFVRFPRWHYCHRCGLMRFLSIFGSPEHCQGGDATVFEKKCKEQYEKSKTKKYIRSPRLIPARFVAVCEVGHIQDFPFMEWLHRDKPFDSASHKLKLRAGRSSAGLSGIVIECSCGIKRSLGNVFEYDKNTKRGALSSDDVNYLCKGLRPWLGEMDKGVDCSPGHLRVLQRGATNVYFPQIVSSIYLPLWAEKISSDVVAILEQPHVWAVLSQGTDSGRIDSTRCQMVAQMRGVDAKELEVAAQRKLDGKPPTGFSSATGDEEEFRRSEYQAICDGKVGPQTELYVECAKLEKYEPEFARLFSRIRLVHKLRETRALTGFTRILPPDGNLASDRLQELKLDQQIDWLPAIKVYGEGIFLEVNPGETTKWEKTVPSLRPEFVRQVSDYNSARAARLQPFRNITAKFVLLHTLAHVLINQLSFDCGYGSASLRERLYCNIGDPSRPMHGILIYTASGDSEGTMGGLVRQGKPGRLETTLWRALRQAAWCSSDPVCIESKGQGSDNANLAACHGCCLLPETSCEEGNRLLDRALLVGTPSQPSLGFFSDLL